MGIAVKQRAGKGCLMCLHAGDLLSQRSRGLPCGFNQFAFELMGGDFMLDKKMHTAFIQ